METLRELLSINYTVLSVVDHRLSLIELVGISSGLASVYWAATANPLTWPVGLLNTAAFFVIFFQVQLYSDMLLQIFFALITLYGWWNWSDAQCGNQPALQKLSASRLGVSVVAVTLGTLALGLLMSKVHVWLPRLVTVPAASPFQDGFTAAASIVASVLLARRAVETWILWIMVDLVSIQLYFTRAIPFMALLYFALLIMATRGFINWRRMLLDATRAGFR